MFGVLVSTSGAVPPPLSWIEVNRHMARGLAPVTSSLV